MSNQDKKYQVFISSTYEDLKEERLAATQVLLDLGCIPIGMEQFPASNMSQMEYITKMLENCDYYILISAGRYGSIDPTDNCGYTEKEYDYAIEKKIPVMSFLYSNPDSLPDNKKDNTEVKRAKLTLFHEKIKSNKMVSFYSSKDELKVKIAIALHQCMLDYPAIGWIRAEGIETDKVIEEKIESYLQKRQGLGEDTFIDEAGGKTVIIGKRQYALDNRSNWDRIVQIKNEIETTIVDRTWIKTDEDRNERIKKPWKIFTCNNIMLKDDSIEEPDFNNGLIKAEPYDFYENGILVISSEGVRNIQVKFSESEEIFSTKAYVVSKIPFIRISGFDKNGSINFPYPTIYCKFIDGSPYDGCKFFDTENGIEYDEKQIIRINP